MKLEEGGWRDIPDIIGHRLVRNFSGELLRYADSIGSRIFQEISAQNGQNRLLRFMRTTSLSLDLLCHITDSSNTA